MNGDWKMAQTYCKSAIHYKFVPFGEAQAILYGNNCILSLIPQGGGGQFKLAGTRWEIAASLEQWAEELRGWDAAGHGNSYPPDRPHRNEMSPLFYEENLTPEQVLAEMMKWRDNKPEAWRVVADIIDRLADEWGVTPQDVPPATVRQNGRWRADIARVQATLDVATLFDDDGRLRRGALADIKETLGLDRNAGGDAYRRARAVADALQNDTTSRHGGGIPANNDLRAAAG